MNMFIYLYLPLFIIAILLENHPALRVPLHRGELDKTPELRAIPLRGGVASVSLTGWFSSCFIIY